MALNNTSHLAYLKYLTLDIPRTLPKADCYIAQSPMETLWLPKNKTIAICHDLIPLLHSNLAGANMNANPIKTFLGSRFYWFGAKAASRCKRIVCNSRQTRDEIKNYFKVPDQRLRVIDLGVRSDLDYKPKQDTTLRIGYIGQLDRRKRVNLLIDAFKKSDIDGELVIGGNGPDRAKLEALAVGDRRIKFLGFVPDDKLCEFYNSLDIFAFPSAAEGWGIPITEAMACAIPVMVWQDSLIPRDLKDRCYPVDGQFDASTMNKVIRLDTLTGYYNYEYAHSLSWDKFVEGVELTIQEVMVG
jgi:glycosyltransferase involved in cell wall biosynthesis